MNWVLVIAGLVPLWAALFIVFSNMRVLKDDTMLTPLAEPAPILQQPQPQIQLQTPLELELAEEEIVKVKPQTEEKKGLFGGLFGRLKKEETQTTEEIDFKEPTAESSVSFGIPKGLKRVWGVAMILVFVACLAYGGDKALAYMFKEYRWVIGTTNPWTSQLQTASVATSAVAGIAVMFATLKTGIHLLRN